MSLAGDLDLVVGDDEGTLTYIENTGTSTAPVYVKRTGSANPFDGIAVSDYSAPALGDLDNDGTLGPCPSIGKLSAISRFLSLTGDLDVIVGDINGVLDYFANGYCTTSCSGRGVCDGSANLLPTCDCLTGFTGDQCDECQAGYFGSACELSKIDDAASNSASVSDARRDTCGESLHASRRLVEATAATWCRRDAAIVITNKKLYTSVVTPDLRTECDPSGCSPRLAPPARARPSRA